MSRLPVLCLLVLSYAPEGSGHGLLLIPPGRSSMWRHGFPVPPNYDDNAINCGGFGYQQEIGGKCGVCGDAYGGPRNNEAGGKYASGIIGGAYRPGTWIQVTVELTANHGGWFEFKLCPHNRPNVRIKKRCLNQYILEVERAGNRRFQIDKTTWKAAFNLRVRLPPGVTCSQCVMQWFYKAAQNKGSDETGTDCFGCGPQEQFINCADIAIGQSYVRKFKKYVKNLATYKKPDVSDLRRLPDQPVAPIAQPASAPVEKPTPKTKRRCKKKIKTVGGSKVIYTDCSNLVVVPKPGTGPSNKIIPPNIPDCGNIKLICEGIGLFFDRPGFNDFCQNSCPVLECSEMHCICYCEGTKPDYQMNCHGVRTVFDKWCLTNCNMGNCPPDTCVCVK